MALRLSTSVHHLVKTVTPTVTCVRGVQKLARLHKLCNFTGPADVEPGWIKIIGYYGTDRTPKVGHVVKVWFIVYPLFPDLSVTLTPFAQVTYKGNMYKAVITGLVRDRVDCPRFDTNNCVFINDRHEPLGTRITGPVSLKLLQYGKFKKVTSLCSEFY